MVAQISLVFLLGVCIGSFLNVCIWRIPLGKSIIFPASQCVACGKKLKVLDLVPVLNYFYLRGRCRWCGTPFSWQYPLIECITGILFVLIWLKHGSLGAALAGWVFAALLVTISVIDYYHLIIPNRLILTGLGLGVPLLLIQSGESLILGVLSMLAAGLFMLIIALISRGGMGGGDVKLAAMLGLYLGPQNAGVALFLAFMIAGTVALFLLVAGIKGRKDAIPFGPFLALGAIIAELTGDHLLAWYSGFWG
jgi:leader peptidase (prepilin peptidase)/N-methyltransferase